MARLLQAALRYHHFALLTYPLQAAKHSSVVEMHDKLA